MKLIVTVSWPVGSRPMSDIGSLSSQVRTALALVCPDCAVRVEVDDYEDE